MRKSPGGAPGDFLSLAVFLKQFVQVFSGFGTEVAAVLVKLCGGRPVNIDSDTNFGVVAVLNNHFVFLHLCGVLFFMSI